MSGIHLPLQKPTGTMITDSNGVDVANVLTGTRRTIAEHEELANLIVRAVNNHDALLEACKALRDRIEALQDTDEYGIEDKEAWEKGCAAIAAAEARE